MNERVIPVSVTLIDPTDTAAIGNTHYYWDCIFGMTIVAVSAAPEKDDTDATIDIDDDGTNVISAVSAADANVPGTWKSTHVGGTNTPVYVAAGSKLSFDANSAANGTAFHVVLYVVMGELSA